MLTKGVKEDSMTSVPALADDILALSGSLFGVTVAEEGGHALRGVLGNERDGSRRARKDYVRLPMRLLREKYG